MATAALWLVTGRHAGSGGMPLQQPWSGGSLCAILQEMEDKKMTPELYPYNSRGPVGAHYLAAKHGVRWGDMADNENPGMDM